MIFCQCWQQAWVAALLQKITSAAGRALLSALLLVFSRGHFFTSSDAIIAVIQLISRSNRTFIAPQQVTSAS